MLCSFISFVESIKGLKQLELRSIVAGVDLDLGQDLGRMRHAALEDIRVFVDERGHPDKLVSLASLKQLTMLGIRARVPLSCQIVLPFSRHLLDIICYLVSLQMLVANA